MKSTQVSNCMLSPAAEDISGLAEFKGELPYRRQGSSSRSRGLKWSYYEVDVCFYQEISHPLSRSIIHCFTLQSELADF